MMGRTTRCAGCRNTTISSAGRALPGHRPLRSSRYAAATKPAVLRGYAIDPVAQLDTLDLTFDWFDYILKGAQKPDLLKDKINYQVMGANAWRHAPSIEKMSESVLTLYLDSAKDGAFYRLAKTKPPVRGSLKRVVDYADRTTVSANSYPVEIVTGDLGLSQALAFVSEPFDRPVSVNGLFSATLRGLVNKKDLDLAGGVVRSDA